MSLNFPPGPQAANNLLDALHLMRAMQKDLLGLTKRYFETYGPIWSIEVAAQRVFVISDPALIQEVCVKQADKFQKDRDYTDRQKGLARFLGNGLLTSDGAFWKQQRKLVAPAFHTGRIEAYAHTMIDCTERMLEEWEGQHEIDVDTAMMRATLQIVAKTLFNVDISADADRIGDAMTVMQRMSGSNNSMEALLPAWVPTPQRWREGQAVRNLNEIVYRLIGEWRDQGKDNGDLLSMLLLARNDDGQGMTDEQVRDEAVTLFVAGHETTANTLNWTWYLLAQHPQIEAKLHQEIDTVLQGCRPSLSDLKSLPYAQMIIKESMRLYPPAFGFGRVAIEDTVIGGYSVPRGTNISVLSYHTHRDPRWWDAPEEFRPERFDTERESTIPRYAYLPFGAGPRICIGNSFAMMEAQLMLVLIAQRFRLHMTPGQVVQPEPLLTLRPKGGLPMRLEARQHIRTLQAEAVME